MAPTLTIGLVLEAMRKMVSLVIGALASLSRKPKESNMTSLPLRAISTTAPGSSLFLTPSFRRSLSRFSRVDTNPTSSGDCALGIPWATAGNAIASARAAHAIERTNDIETPPNLPIADFLALSVFPPVVSKNRGHRHTADRLAAGCHDPNRRNTNHTPPAIATSTDRICGRRRSRPGREAQASGGR